MRFLKVERVRSVYIFSFINYMHIAYALKTIDLSIVNVAEAWIEDVGQFLY